MMPRIMQHSMRATDDAGYGLLGEAHIPWNMQHSMRATDLGELPLISDEGMRYIDEALDEDPEVAPAISRLLDSWDAPGAISRQVKSDLVEAIKPSGKKIVFKSLVRELLPKIKHAEGAIIRSITDPSAIRIMAWSENPEEDLARHYTHVAVESLESSGMSGLGQLPFPRSVLAQQQELQLAAARAPQVIVQQAPAQTQQAVANAVNNISMIVGDGVKSTFTPTTGAPTVTAPQPQPQIVYQPVPQFMPQPQYYPAPQPMYMPEYQAAPPRPATFLTPTSWGDGGSSAMVTALPGEEKKSSLLPLAIAAGLMFMQGKK